MGVVRPLRQSAFTTNQPRPGGADRGQCSARVRRLRARSAHMRSSLVLHRVFEVVGQGPPVPLPDEIAEQVLEEAGMARARTNAKLPPRLVLRLVAGLGLLRSLSIPDVLARIAHTWGAPAIWHGVVPVSTSIALARDRLGVDVVVQLFERFSAFLVDNWLSRNRWKGLVTVALDGTTFNAPDSPANVAAFGRPGGRNGSGGFPQLRLLALVSTASHFVLGCVQGPCKGKGTGELTLARQVLPLLRPDWLLLMDRGFCSYTWLKDLGDSPFFVRKTQGRSAIKPKKLEVIRPRRDWKVTYVPASLRGNPVPLCLRLVRIKLPKKRGAKQRWVEFLTNLSPTKYPYEDLQDLYLKRWEVEFAFRELKCDLLEKRNVFRSKTPERVQQELYGLLIGYNAIRLRMAKAAKRANLEPRELSFRRTAGLCLLAWFAALPENTLVKLIANCRIPKRKRARSYPRVVKRPASKFAANKTRASPR